MSILQEFDYETYTNLEVIAVNQDPLGVQGHVIWNNCPPYNPATPTSSVPACQQIWARPLADGSFAVAFANFDTVPTVLVCDAACFGAIGMSSALVRDLWAHEDIGLLTNLTVPLGGDGSSAIYRFYPQ